LRSELLAAAVMLTAVLLVMAAAAGLGAVIGALVAG